MVPHPAAIFAFLSQQPGTGNAIMGVNPFTGPAGNAFALQHLSVTNPLSGNNSSQLIGRNVEWQSVGKSGNNNLPNAFPATTTSCSYDGRSEGCNDSQENENERMQSLRDRNRVHARSARQRKKAYVHELKSLVESLHSERSEEIRKRHVAAQRTVDIQKVRRRVISTFLNYHSRYQVDPRKWSSILDESFWLKQPITPFRSFRGSEIENVSCSAVIQTKGLHTQI
jgi:hypothetical protein